MNERSALITLLTTSEESLRVNLVHSRIDTIERIEINGQYVGDINYGINPPGDRLNIALVEICAVIRFRGVGLRTLWRFWETH
jgi:excinuclease UvrABC helicase subunit UvrB